MISVSFELGRFSSWILKIFLIYLFKTGVINKDRDTLGGWWMPYRLFSFCNMYKSEEIMMPIWLTDKTGQNKHAKMS